MITTKSSDVKQVRADAIVVHSGGMDSSLCLAIAIERFGAKNVLSMSFRYGQRHVEELTRARLIADKLGVKNIVFPINCLQEITTSALMDPTVDILHDEGEMPNTAVIGRNGLMVRIAAIHAHQLGAKYVYTGVIEVESANSGYPDCSRFYMDKMQEILRLDLETDEFYIETPVALMTKSETMALGWRMGILPFLLETTITCYRGVEKQGCMNCPACRLRNEGIVEFLGERPELEFSYKPALLDAYQASKVGRVKSA
jgi:7-cyano-7-deazaguanine synthase